ncbi:MAG: hypothetical protein Ct9H300mP1_25860 [Planctomycetaceae bacterium]|nr:MAG: hypothetical protein Ct9H300mP1_25860 [Planctomycetaceae bacterium]
MLRVPNNRAVHPVLCVADSPLEGVVGGWQSIGRIVEPIGRKDVAPRDRWCRSVSRAVTTDPDDGGLVDLHWPVQHATGFVWPTAIEGIPDGHATIGSSRLQDKGFFEETMRLGQ